MDAKAIVRSISARMTTIAVTAAITVGLTTAGVAVAGSTGVINACVNSASGTLRIVAAGSACLPNENALEWSQQGPQGPMGPQGPKGDTGATGAQGVPGVSGYQQITAANVPLMTPLIQLADGTQTVDPAGCSGTACNVYLYCPSGLSPISGGYALRRTTTSSFTNGLLNITQDRPFAVAPADADALMPVGAGWRVGYNTRGITDPTAIPPLITVVAICARTT